MKQLFRSYLFLLRHTHHGHHGETGWLAYRYGVRSRAVR